MSGEKTAREMAPMERLLQDAGLLRDAHFNMAHRLIGIREKMMGNISENPMEKTNPTERSGAFGVLQDRLSEMDELLNTSMNEVYRIEKALGVSAEVAPPAASPVRLGR